MVTEKQLIREIDFLKNALKRETERNERLVKKISELEKGQIPKKGQKGRPSLERNKVLQVERLGDLGCSVREIERKTGVSLGAISKILQEYRRKKSVVREIEFMHDDKMCTRILIYFIEERIEIENHTDDNIDRAFGCVEHPTWEQFMNFIEERCFPRTRDGMKNILRDLEIQSYDPWQIIQKTEGRMAEDRHWIRFVGGI